MISYLISHLRNALIGALIGGFSVIAFTYLFNFFAPASFFISNASIYVEDAKVGEPPQFEFCRNPRSDIAADVSRLFFIKSEDGFDPVSEYTFSPTIEKSDDSCQTLSLSVNRQPQDPGTYRLRTIYRFIVGGHEKALIIESNEYEYK